MSFCNRQVRQLLTIIANGEFFALQVYVISRDRYLFIIFPGREDLIRYIGIKWLLTKTKFVQLTTSHWPRLGLAFGFRRQAIWYTILWYTQPRPPQTKRNRARFGLADGCVWSADARFSISYIAALASASQTQGPNAHSVTTPYYVRLLTLALLCVYLCS